MKIKVKIWLENENEKLVFGDGKNEVMKQIDLTGSLSETSDKLNMTEEKVLKHLQIIEDNNKDEMVLCVKGLKDSSKASYVLTAEAREMLQTYQIYQHDVRKFTKNRFSEIFGKEI